MVNRIPNPHFPIPNSQFPLVSIIVTTKNEERNIANCLKSILNSQFPIPNPQFPVSNSQSSLEVIVVDNNSTDCTKEIVTESEKWLAPLNVQIFNGGPERSAQRNFGIKKASSKYILYLDADMILSENVISECVGKFNKWEKENGKRELAALYIPERIVGEGFGVKVRDFERSFYNATCIDCVRFVLRDKFLEIGGFDETLTGPEDWDFDRRIKKVGKVDIVNVPIYHNEGEFNLKEYLSKKSYYSKSFNKYIDKWGKDDKIVKKQLGFWYRYFGVFVENGKWRKMLWHPVLTMRMYALRVMVGVQYLPRIRKS